MQVLTSSFTLLTGNQPTTYNVYAVFSMKNVGVKKNPFQYRMNDHCCDYDRTPGLTWMVIINDGYYY